MSLLALTLLLAQPTAPPPNIVFVLVDDLGWADLGCYSDLGFETPHIDRLAAEGMRFTDFYAACPVCSPTRAAIQSGQYQARLRITDFIPGHFRPFEKLVVPYNAPHLPHAIETPAELLAAADYRSGYFGKWHLGNPPTRQPSDQGYDVAEVQMGHWSKPDGRRSGEKDGSSAIYGTDRMTTSAVGFLEDHQQNHAEQPFLLFLSPFAVHIPLAAKAEKVKKYEEKLGGKSGPEGVLPSPVYAAMVEHVDDMVGAVVAKLDEQNLTKNTLVIVTSDNGGLYKMYTGEGHRVTDNGPLRGEKGTVYEGGIRVPMIAKWPAKILAGTICDEPTISIDFWPTFAQLAGVGPNDDTQLIDGVSLVPVLTDADATLDRDAIYWHYPHYHHMDPAAAVRAGEWKLIRHFDGSPTELYHLGEDIGETEDLAPSHAAKVAELDRKLDDWLLEVDALLPTKNDNADPSRAAEWWSRRSGKKQNSLRGYVGADVR